MVGGLVSGSPARAAEAAPGSRVSTAVTGAQGVNPKHPTSGPPPRPVGGRSKDHRNTSEDKMRIVAVEEAFSVPGSIRQEEAIRQHMAVPEAIKQEWFRRLDDLTELRLADMDANGVDVQVLSYSTPGVEVIEDPAEAVAAARRINDYLAKAIASHPTRFAGFATLPLQDPKAAVVELRRAVTELGFKGVLYNDHVRGHYLDEPQFRPVWAELERLGVTLYLHPAVVPADNWHVFDGYPVLVGPSWGWTATTGAHALRLIYGGVFDEFPRASVMLGHMGELLPFQMARLDSRYDQVPPSTGCNTCPRTTCGTTCTSPPAESCRMPRCWEPSMPWVSTGCCSPSTTRSSPALRRWNSCAPHRTRKPTSRASRTATPSAFWDCDEPRCRTGRGIDVRNVVGVKGPQPGAGLGDGRRDPPGRGAAPRWRLRRGKGNVPQSVTTLIADGDLRIPIALATSSTTYSKPSKDRNVLAR